MDILWFLFGFLAAYLLAGAVLAILAWRGFAAVDPPREEVWRCRVCGREFVSRYLLERHIRWHIESARPGHGSPPPRIVREAEEIVRRMGKQNS